MGSLANGPDRNLLTAACRLPRAETQRMQAVQKPAVGALVNFENDPDPRGQAFSKAMAASPTVQREQHVLFECVSAAWTDVSPKAQGPAPTPTTPTKKQGRKAGPTLGL